MATPYAPTTFTTPVVAATAGGAGVAARIPFISLSEYMNYPTSMDTLNLVPQGDSQQQQAAFFDLLQRASAWIDRLTMGMSLAAKGASLRATLNTEMAAVPLIRGTLRLICDFWPVLEVRGVDVGIDPSSLATIGTNLAAGIRLGRRTIYVPFAQPFLPASQKLYALQALVPADSLVVAWSYVNGYPHTQLATTTTGGSPTLQVLATDGASGLLGVYPGTQLTIVDGALTETITVQSVSGTTITATANLQNVHTVPATPDFIPVTGLPTEVRMAGIYLMTGLLKTRGDEALLLQEAVQPRQRMKYMGDLPKDFMLACKMLAPYTIRLKANR